MTAVAAWSQDLTAGKTVTITPPADIKITNIALGSEIADKDGRTTVKMTYPKLPAPDDEDEEGVETVTATIGSLTPGKIEHLTTDLFLFEDTIYQFELVGKNTICLAGYYVDQNADQPPGGFGEFGSDMDSEDEHDLRFVSSDVEIDPDELDDTDTSRFEEVEEGEKAKAEKPQSKKRPRDSAGEDGKPATKAEKKSKKQKTEKAEGEAKKEKGEKKKEQEGAEKQLAGGLKIKDSKVGTGPMAKKGQDISMRYIGKLQNGKTFDSNTKGKPFKFRLGAGEVIKGWDEGIVGMQAGGERVLTVPPAMGYGKRGSGPIPSNATLIFEVKCIEIK
ncbi:hypothetical protein D9758_001975 [Tetrapyrgos nigripes]|uniref:peptidylprolyl isomerase n=1 Tax=Tetrapyrgos nigripes TaxID=182062 RepID=A0A8H5GTK0_9AGAR|nr:hypothetical protein D9758_001975 [Tetrapyrgos nigripes]